MNNTCYLYQKIKLCFSHSGFFFLVLLENCLRVNYPIWFLKRNSFSSAKEKIWDLMHLVSQTNKTNILFASAEGNSISVFNLQGVQIPILD